MANLEISRAKRLDQKVVELIPELSRASGSKLIEQGKVTVNGTSQTKAGYKLRPGDQVAVNFDLKQLEDIPTISLKVLYEDDDADPATLGDVALSWDVAKRTGVLRRAGEARQPEYRVVRWEAIA